MKDGHFLYEVKSANYWEEAFPIGSGSLGAMVFGGVQREKLSLNHDELWSGYPGLEYGSPDGGDYSGDHSEGFRKARELALQDRLHEAERVLEESVQGNDCQAYMPFGDLILDFNISGEVQRYQRILNLADAVAETSFEIEGKRVKRTAFASFPGRVIVYRVESECPISVVIGMESPLKHECFAEGNRLTLKGEAPSYFARRDPNVQFRYWEEPEHRGMTFESAVDITCDGKISAERKCIRVTEASVLTLVFSADTSFVSPSVQPFAHGKPPHPAVEKHLKDAAEKGYEVLLKEHKEDFHTYYDRVRFDIGSNQKEKIPTSERLVNFLTDKNDLGLYTLIFNFGRYLIISSSRPGTQPTNLQGIWNDKPNPPWNANYTTNINTEMNYWPVLPCNLPEFAEPLHRMLEECLENGRNTAKNFYGAGGFAVHHNVDLWRHTVPVTGMAQWSFWPMAAGWISRHLFEYYEYTGDTGFLKEKAYPLIREAALFYLDVLCDDGKGELALIPSTSPENSFKVAEGNCSVSLTTTMTMSIIREVFENLLKTEKLLGSGDMTERVQSALSKLWMPKIGSRGQMLEWFREEEEVEPHHRHTSHLYGLYPAALFTEETPAYFAACRRTLEERGDDGTGWSLGWKIHFWARLNDGDHALKLLDNQLRYKNPDNTAYNYSNGGGTYPNLFDAHPPFQIDGNFGCVSGICEMLVRSIGNKITLLPALPKKWSSGEVRGIAVKGGGTVDVIWQNGELLSYVLHGGNGSEEVYCNGKRLK